MNRCCGLDVQKDSVFACILEEQGKKIIEKRYGTYTPELDRLRDTLVENGTGHVAMESTGIYWIPLWRTLQSDFLLKLANPYFIKQLPGRKSDVKDAQWLAQCLQKELIRGSFVPDDVLQQMRQYARQHRRLTGSRVRIEQQMDNQLQRCNIRFSNYVSHQSRDLTLRIEHTGQPGAEGVRIVCETFSLPLFTLLFCNVGLSDKQLTAHADSNVWNNVSFEKENDTLTVTWKGLNGTYGGNNILIETRHRGIRATG
jgi:hypothetical protein